MTLRWNPQGNATGDGGSASNRVGGLDCRVPKLRDPPSQYHHLRLLPAQAGKGSPLVAPGQEHADTRFPHQCQSGYMLVV